MNYYEIIKNEPMFFTRIGLGANPDVRNEKGKITFNAADYSRWDEFLLEHKAFKDMGCKIQTTCIHSGWVGEDEYDYSAVDETLEKIFSLGDDVLYLPRVNLNAPLKWLQANPEEIAISSYADKSLVRIAEIYSSFRTLHEIANIRGGGVNQYGVYMQSFFSDKWLVEASEALRRFIEHLEKSKYAERIVGYQVAYGMCGEACNWGAWANSEHWGDFSRIAEQAFFRFCEEKYGDFKAVKEVYGMPDLSPDDIIPTPEERFGKSGSIEEYFRLANQRAIDFSIFLSDRVAKNICDFAAAGKEKTDKPIGSFYGYLLTRFPTETGHIGIQRLIDCDDVDFLCAPKIYYRCGAGEPGGSQATSMSVARKKIWLDELDNDTHIAKCYQEEANHPTSFFETKTILWRKVARNLSWNNQNFWWMDLYGGWFIDDEIQAEMKKIIRFNRKMRAKPHRSVSEILFVIDEKAFAYQRADESFAGCRQVGVINEMGAELKKCGAPVDEYRLEDLKELDLSQYKIIVFANAFVLDEEKRKIIRAIPESTLCVWNYAAGVRYGEKFDLSFTADLTGMEIAECKGALVSSNGYGAKTTCPPLKIVDKEGLIIIERYEDGAIKTAKNRNHLLAVSPGFRSNDFHELVKSVGCHLYASADCAVFADERFVGIFPGKDGADLLDLGEGGGYVDFISGKRAENCGELEPNGAYVFVRE